MRNLTSTLGQLLALLALGLILAGCAQSGATLPRVVEPVQTSTATAGAPVVADLPAAAAAPATDAEPASVPTEGVTATPTAAPPSEAEVADAMDLVQDFLGRLADGGFREVYGSLLTTAGQQRLADLVLGRLALTDPHISFFEIVGAEPAEGRIAVDVVWQESYADQGLVGTQPARILLARQAAEYLVDDVELSEYRPAATPPPPPLPRAEALTNPAVPGQDMQFRVSGFESGETVVAWLELPDGTLTAPTFQSTDADGVFELTYAAETTQDLQPGRWIWWAQALRNSARNTGITFDVLAPPTPTVTPTPRPAPTRAPQPTATPAIAAPPTAPDTQPAPVATVTPEPAPAGYGAPTLLWPEVETSRNYGSALIVEFVPVAGDLAPNELYELVLVASDAQGNVYNGGSVRGRGNPCSGQYNQPCLSLIADERFMDPFHRGDVEGKGTWYVQVVRQTSDDQYTQVSPPSEPRTVILKPR